MTRKIPWWINEHFSLKLKDSDYNRITDFLLLWTIFERELFSSSCKFSLIKSYISDNIREFDETSCEAVFSYFKSRYRENDACFESLRFRDRDPKEAVKNAFLSEAPLLEDKIFASMAIIYRYRNNLFHGIKDVTTINYQKDNFIYANKMLKLFIETKWNKTQ